MPTRGKPPTRSTGRGGAPAGIRGRPPQARGGSGTVAAPSSSGGGFFGTLEHAVTNLGTGAERSVLGLPSAIGTVYTAAAKDVAHNPWLAYGGPMTFIPGEIWTNVAAAAGAGHQTRLATDVAKPLAKSYAYKYGPLFHGHPGTTLHRALVEDPFGTLLDASVVLSSAAKVAGLSGLAKETALRELPLRGPEALTKSAKLLKKNPDLTVITRDQPATLGGRAVRGTAFGPRALHKVMRALPADTPVVGELSRFNKALSALPRKVAAARRLQAIPLDKALRKLTKNERVATALIARWPIPRLLDAQIGKWEQLAAQGKDVGALALVKDAKVRALYETPTPRMASVLAEARRLGEFDAKTLAQYDKLAPEQAAAAPYLHMRLASGAKFEEGNLAGGLSIPDLQAEAAATGRPEPVYLHDTSIDKLKTGPQFEPAGGGTSPVPRSPIRQNEGVLAGLGQLLLDPGTLVSQHFRVVKYGLYRDIHASLEDIAMHVPQGSKLPADWEYLRRAVGPTQSTPEKIGYAERTAGEFHRQIAELLPTPEREAALAKQLTTIDEAQAATNAAGDRLIVPTSTVRNLTGEFQRANRAVRWLIEKPLDVWRAILLNLSPRWLTNNLVGNTFMGLIRFGGVKFIRNWLAAVFEHGGPAPLERLLKDQMTTARLTASDIAELFPEQVIGTFKGQNMPFQNSTALAAGKFRRVLREGLSPIDRGYEQALRRAAVNTQVQKSPEVVAILKRMPRQQRSWRAASKQALRENPALAKKIEQEVNSGLGDFTSLSPAERNYIRRVIPFYAWYRAITGVVLKLPFTVPLRAKFITELSQLRQEEQDLMNPGLPPWLRGAVPFGESGALLTQGMNPYATVPQVARGVGFGIKGGDYTAYQDFLGLLNPALQAFPSSAPQRGRVSPGIIATVLKGTYGGLPPIAAYRLLTQGAPTSKTYQPLPTDYWLSLLGVPIRHLQQPINR